MDMEQILLRFLFVVIVFHSAWSVVVDPNVAEDVKLNTWQLIHKYGYPYELHNVTTADGYILQMHRIPYGRNSSAAANKPVVMLQHGILDSSATWVIMGPGQGFAYILADLGYDVWMGNSRGNLYSPLHVDLNPDASVAESKKYWNFSWHEMGIYDLPACFDYIGGVTGEAQLDYVGHSQGGTQLFVMASERSEYLAKIRTANTMAAAVLMGHTSGLAVRTGAALIGAAAILDENFVKQEFLAASALLGDIGLAVCAEGDITQGLCSTALFTIVGFDPAQINNTKLPIMLSHYPQGSSLKQVNHFGQSIASDLFRQYDYGLLGNSAHYDQLAPPEYDVTKLSVPIGVHYGANDLVVDVKDSKRLVAMLPNVVLDNLVADPKWNHIDFVYGIDAPTLVYKKVVEVIRGGAAKNAV